MSYVTRHSFIRAGRCPQIGALEEYVTTNAQSRQLPESTVCALYGQVTRPRDTFITTSLN